MDAKKESIWFRKLDVAFVYLIIFAVGIVIVLTMTSYINNKVKELSENSIAFSQKG